MWLGNTTDAVKAKATPPSHSLYILVVKLALPIYMIEPFTLKC